MILPAALLSNFKNKPDKFKYEWGKKTKCGIKYPQRLSFQNSFLE